MSVVAILGAGSIGAATAHRLAQIGGARQIRFIDANTDAAAGKALDIQQAGPVENFDARLSATGDVLAAASADVIVIADSLAHGEWNGVPGLALIEQLVRAGVTAPMVFAGPSQVDLIEASYLEAKVRASKLVGTGASALVGTVRALAGLELNLASVDLTVVGRPPALVVGWTAATTRGVLLVDRIPAHRLLAISDGLPGLAPAGPHAIGAATAQVVRALMVGSRDLLPALTILDGVLGARGKAVMLPLELGHGRVLSHVMPSLSAQERTELISGLS